jgi:hypothetical protein
VIQKSWPGSKYQGCCRDGISSSCMQVLQPIGILCFASNWNPLLDCARSGEILFEQHNWSVFVEALELTEAAVYPHPDWVRDCAHDSPSPQCLGSMFALASELGFNVCSKCCHLAFLLILIMAVMKSADYVCVFPGGFHSGDILD